MSIVPSSEVQTLLAPSEYFSGEVWQEFLVRPAAPSRVCMLRVTFLPGGRTHWHTHPAGQTLHVLSGLGNFQAWGGEVKVIRPGDTIWIAPNEKHWHGAAPGHLLVHLAIQEEVDGVQANWLEPVGS